MIRNPVQPVFGFVVMQILSVYFLSLNVLHVLVLYRPRQRPRARYNGLVRFLKNIYVYFLVLLILVHLPRMWLLGAPLVSTKYTKQVNFK